LNSVCTTGYHQSNILQLTDAFVLYNTWEISTLIFASKPFIRLAPSSQPGSFFPPPLGKQSLDVSTNCLSLHLTTLIQSVFDRQDGFLVLDLSFLQH
jgi:hypothetical protein